jgi:hypothetical protein
MRDITTEDLIRTLAISIERRVRAEDILKLESSAKHASAVKARQRDERNALKAINAHLKECVKVVKQGIMTPSEARKKVKLKKPRVTTVYRPTRRGLKKVKP